MLNIATTHTIFFLYIYFFLSPAPLPIIQNNLCYPRGKVECFILCIIFLVAVAFCSTDFFFFYTFCMFIAGIHWIKKNISKMKKIVGQIFFFTTEFDDVEPPNFYGLLCITTIYMYPIRVIRQKNLFYGFDWEIDWIYFDMSLWVLIPNKIYKKHNIYKIKLSTHEFFFFFCNKNVFLCLDFFIFIFIYLGSQNKLIGYKRKKKCVIQAI